ncbi:MAG: hypothetical protein JWO36_7460 [Myxococcales bacterium]|nr:hypothetical protein [Myxococcales bacterium]
MRHLLVVAAVLGLTACADPAVGVELKLPSNADMLDTSCLTAIEVHANGTNYPRDPMDFKRSCIEISGQATYAKVADAVRGQLSLPIPDSGLAGIEMFGWSGASACGDPQIAGTTPDLIFFAGSAYIGQDTVQMAMTPNLNCVQSQIKVRLLDLFTLVSGASPSDQNCTAAMIPDAGGAAYIGTLTPNLFEKGTTFFGNLIGGVSHAGLVTMSAYTQVGPKSCLAFNGFGATSESVSCAMSGPTVCAATGEVEHVAVNGDIGIQTLTLQPALIAKYPGIVYGSVWSGGASKHPIAGATVEVDSSQGAVVYIDPPDTGSVSVKLRTDNKTGPTGLFLVYTNTLATIRVNANGAAQRTVVVGSPGTADGAALIVMN